MLMSGVLIAPAQARGLNDLEASSTNDQLASRTFAENFAKEPSEAPVQGTCCSSCGQQGCCQKNCCGTFQSECNIGVACDDYWFSQCNKGCGWGGYLYSFGDAFRGPGDGSYTGNGGGVVGFNMGKQINDSPWGVQFGGSYGSYDWKGRESGTGEDTISQTQLFFTGGLYRKASADSPFSMGLVYDTMVNDNFGSNSDEPFLSQFRLQFGYALNARNEVGTWMALADRTANQAPMRYRAENTYNLYFNHKFVSGAQTVGWIGAAQNTRLTANGSLYSFIFGNTTIVPMTERLSAFTQFTYAFPSSSNGAGAADDETFNVSAGIIFYPRFNARSRSVSGAAWMPYMPVANNGNFLVDSTQAP